MKPRPYAFAIALTAGSPSIGFTAVDPAGTKELEIQVENSPIQNNLNARSYEALYNLGIGVIIGITLAAVLTVIRRKIG